MKFRLGLKCTISSQVAHLFQQDCRVDNQNQVPEDIENNYGILNIT